MPTWRRIETDPTPGESTDTLEVSKAVAKGKPKKKVGNLVSIHFCPHAAGEPASEWYNCRDDVRSQYEEF